jgi:hypothetical protein
VATAQQAVKDYQELLRLSKVKRGAGQVAGLDVAEAGAKFEFAQIELSNLQALFIAAQRNLEPLLGRYPAAAVDIGLAKLAGSSENCLGFRSLTSFDSANPPSLVSFSFKPPASAGSKAETAEPA